MKDRTPALVFVAALACFGGIGTLNQTVLLAAIAGTGNAILLPFVALGAVVALVQLVAAVGIMRMDSWARTLGIAAFSFVLVLSVVVAMFATPGATTVYQIGGSVVAIGVLYVKDDAFGRSERPVDELSPHVGR